MNLDSLHATVQLREGFNLVKFKLARFHCIYNISFINIILEFTPHILSFSNPSADEVGTEEEYAEISSVQREHAREAALPV